MFIQWTSEAQNRSIVEFIALAVVTFINLGVGFGLTKLQTWARWTDVILAAIGFVLTVFTLVTVLLFATAANRPAITGLFIGYGIGLLIIGYIIYLLVSPKASVVFSPEYRDVIKATPHIKYKISCLLKGLLFLLLGFFLLGIVALVFRGLQGGR